MKSIISDYHGTIISSNEEESNKNIGYTILNDNLKEICKGRITKLPTLGRLAAVKILTERKLEGYKKGKNHLKEVYKYFNLALRGLPVYYITGIVDRYAKRYAEKIDKRIIRPIKAMHDLGSYTGILSAGYDYCIKRTLEESGYLDVFDDIVANTLEQDNNRALGLSLEIYGRKPEVIKSEFFSKRGLKERNTFYFGDSEFDDEPIAEMLPSGNFVVPFLATDEFKEKMANKYKAFVPENEEDLIRYLRSR